MHRSDQLHQTLSARSYLTNESHHNVMDTSTRRRGRPRITASPNAHPCANPDANASGIGNALQDRRSQIRRAQRTYRLKKEAAIQNLRTRVADLEKSLHTVSFLADGLHDAVTNTELELPPSHLALLDQIRTAAGQSQNQNQDRSGSRNDVPKENNAECDFDGVFGYQISRLPPFQEMTVYTYSYHESTFARRLHRFSLEQTYSWFIDPSSPPAWIVHVFGLLPCLPDKQAVQRNYSRVLRAGVGESLEVRALPFYSIGGAGMHYPRKDAGGQPVYPENTREPNRILDRAVNAMFGDGDKGQGQRERQRERQLEKLDLEGEWFDCHDVQGYLENLGIKLDCLSSAVHAPTAQSLLSEWIQEPETASLDVERFLIMLVRNTRILGRAPGFKRSDVDAALKDALET